MKVIILGNGVAGVMAAAELRKLRPKSEELSIDLHTRETYDYYSRIRLPEVISEGTSAEEIRLYPASWYESRNIAVHKGEEALEIDRPARRVRFNSGKIVTYDKLIIAIGADCATAPIPGADRRGVFSLREYPDALSLRSRLAGGGKAVVIGGGLLGLEAARNMLKAGDGDLTVVEIFPRLIPRQLDADGARILVALVRKPGMRVILGARTASFGGGDEVDSVALEDGRILPARTVLVSMGIRPRASLAKAAGLAVGRGIVVDASLRSTDPDIFAVGDVAEFEGVIQGIIPAALEMAPVVADAIAGEGKRRYARTVQRNTLKVAGIDLTSVGKVTFDEGPDDAFEEVARTWPGDERYEKFVLKAGALAGAVLLGSKENVNWAVASMGKPISTGELERRLGRS